LSCLVVVSVSSVLTAHTHTHTHTFSLPGMSEPSTAVHSPPAQRPLGRCASPASLSLSLSLSCLSFLAYGSTAFRHVFPPPTDHGTARRCVPLEQFCEKVKTAGENPQMNGCCVCLSCRSGACLLFRHECAYVYASIDWLVDAISLVDVVVDGTVEWLAGCPSVCCLLPARS